MIKQIIGFLTCGLLVVCFCFPISAAQYYPQKTVSGTSNDVSHYCTIELRGINILEFVPFSNSASSPINGNSVRGLSFHISYTIRNRSGYMAVADLNNFVITSPNIYSEIVNFVGSANSSDIGIANAFVSNCENVDVYDISFNSTASGSLSANTFQMSFRYVEPLVLEPDSQIDMQFDVTIPFSETWSEDLSPYNNFYTRFNASSWSLGSLPSYSLSTMDEYVDNTEGFWPFLLRYIRSIHDKLYGEDDAYEAVEDSSVSVDNSASSASSSLDSIHEQEQQWYNDNDRAIAATGLSNFEYTQDQLTGISHVVGQWGQVWSSLGSWNTVYIFTLLLSLATFILRHEPTTKLKQKRELRDMYYSSGINRNFATADYYNLAHKDLNDRRKFRSSEGGSGDLLRHSLKKR